MYVHWSLNVYTLERKVYTLGAQYKKRRGVGRTAVLMVRMTPGGMGYIDSQAKANGLDRSDYVRGLIEAEAKANKAGRSLFIEGYKP